VIVVNKLIMKCNFTFFENTQGVCLRESVYVCVWVFLCVLVCGDGRDLCVCVSCVWEERERLRKKVLLLLFVKDFGHLKDAPMLAKDWLVRDELTWPR
jgi:hypothetical protein